MKQHIQVAVEAWIADNERLQGLGISISTSLLQLGQSSDIDTLLKMADKSMYATKRGIVPDAYY